MKKIMYFVFLYTLLLPMLGFAQELSLSSYNWDFVAPSIYDTSTLTGAANGLIIYDSKTDSFYAKGPASGSDWRSFSQGPAYVGTQNLGTCTTAMNVDWSKASAFTVTLTSGDTCVFTFANIGNGQTITIWLTNGASGGTGVVTWPTAKWQGGTPPTMTTGTAALDVCTFTSNGSAVAGSCVQGMQ